LNCGSLELPCSPELPNSELTQTHCLSNLSGYAWTAKEIPISKISVFVACVLLWICASTSQLPTKFHIHCPGNAASETRCSKLVTILNRKIVPNKNLFKEVMVWAKKKCMDGITVNGSLIWIGMASAMYIKGLERSTSQYYSYSQIIFKMLFL
jgi:hypothetical protein